jgi:exopolysaccharide biosynthesis polyprenyl glycosylphosphotransferase
MITSWKQRRHRHFVTRSLDFFRNANFRGTIIAGSLRDAGDREPVRLFGGTRHLTLLDNAVHRMARTQPSRSARLIPLAAAIGDFMLLALATVVAMIGRQQLMLFDPRTDVASFVSAAAGPLLVGWLAMLLAVGAYARDIFGAGTEEYKLIIKSSVLSAALVGIGCYLTGFPLSRGFFLLVFTIGTPLLLMGRFVFRRSIQHTRRHGHLRQGVIIAGNPRHVDEVAAVLRRESWLGYTVLGALSTPGTDIIETPAGIPVLGTTSDAAAAIEGVGADVIVFADGAFSSAHGLRQTMWTLESLSVQAIVVPSLTDVSSERLKVRPVAGLPLVHLEAPRTLHASHWAKRLFDIVGSALLLVLTAPVTLAAAIAVKLTDGGPVLFHQTRIGRDGRPFSCLKFRSMVVNAEQLREDLVVNHERSAVLFKMVDDPRVTRPGRLIRRLSVDELPQLWNVLRGQMSLVGPRPPLPHEAARYGSDMSRRLRVRPGMTGLWQVSGRSDLSWDETVRLDLYYVDNWSMVQDITILIRTLSAVLSSRGAY